MEILFISNFLKIFYSEDSRLELIVLFQSRVVSDYSLLLLMTYPIQTLNYSS